MSYEIDDVAGCALAVCAARLDASVPAAAFVELVDQLIQAAHDNALGLLPPANDDTELDTPPSKPERRIPRSPKGRGGRPKLTWDDKQRIKSRYEAAKGDSLLAPKGFVAGLASEYDVSEQTIRNALHEVGA